MINITIKELKISISSSIIIQCKHKQQWRHDDEIDDLR